jgi:peroxiredoxin
MLKPGDPFPVLSVDVVGGESVQLPDALAGSHGVVLFYRGSWCPYCNAQLRAFQRAESRLAEAGVKAVALSVDDAATTHALIDKVGLTFPIGHIVDAAHRPARRHRVQDEYQFIQARQLSVSARQQRGSAHGYEPTSDHRQQRSIHTTGAAHITQDLPAPLTPPAHQPGSCCRNAARTRSRRASGFALSYRSSTAW